MTFSKHKFVFDQRSWEGSRESGLEEDFKMFKQLETGH